MVGLYKVYLAKLKRVGKKPTCVYKVGITSSRDAMNRLLYNESDEKEPISNHFNDIKIMRSIPNIPYEQALKIESFIMNRIKGNDKNFHNWFEESKISGITEMRIWNYEEVTRIIKIMDIIQTEIQSVDSKEVLQSEACLVQ